MPRQNTIFANDEIYHISLRAVGETSIFLDESDYFRGIFSIYEFNNKNYVNIWRRRRERITEKKAEAIVWSPTPHNSIDKRDRFVDIFAFAFMPNHIHLLVKQLKDNGITNFMKKVGGGYANYFNNKYKRKGHLFNQFQAVFVKDDNQFRNVFAYIHANPISIIEPGFKEEGIKSPEKVLNFLENYKWTSYLDYIGRKNFPSVTNREFASNEFGGINGCRGLIKNWIDYKKWSD